MQYHLMCTFFVWGGLVVLVWGLVFGFLYGVWFGCSFVVGGLNPQTRCPYLFVLGVYLYFVCWGVFVGGDGGWVVLWGFDF